jgi:hypothetical protein
MPLRLRLLSLFQKLAGNQMLLYSCLFIYEGYHMKPYCRMSEMTYQC